MDGGGPAADIVLSSRVRLARNLAGHAFPHRASSDTAARVLGTVAENWRVLQGGQRTYAFLPMADVEPLDRLLLAERHLISPQLHGQSEHAGVIVSDDQAVSIMVNEEDHLRIQVLLPGLSLEKGWQLAAGVDDQLSERLDFAFDEQYGYLTACPTNVGTGLRASVMMHLPGLVMTGLAGRVLGSLNKVGVTVRGLFGEGSDARGHLFQVSNQITLGQSEEEILQNLTTVGQQIVQRERSARERLYRDHKERIEDEVCRAYGLLTHARLISSEEAIKLLSKVRLGIDLQVLPHVQPDVFNELLISTRPAHLQRLAGATLQPEQRDRRRAALLRSSLTGGSSPGSKKST